MKTTDFIRRHKILSALTGLFGLVCVFIASGIYYVEKQGLKALLNEKGTSTLGRTFSVDGRAHIKWHGLSPVVYLEKVRIANDEGAKDPDMLTIESIEFQVALPRLLIGQLNFPEITITKPQLLLEKYSEEKNNWDMPVFSKGQAVTESVTPDDRHDFPIIGLMTIKEGRFIYRDAVKKLNLNLGIDTALGTADTGDKNLQLSGDGEIDGHAFKLDAVGGSISTLRYSDKDYPLDLHIVLGPTIVDFKGTLRDPVKLTGIDATLTLEGHTMADLFNLTGFPLPPTPPYKLGGHLKKDGEVWSYNEFTGKVGDSDLNGNLTYDLSDERGLVTAALTSKLLDADDLGGFIGLAPSTKKGEAIAPEQKALAAQQAASERALPDIPINLSRLRAADMDVTLKADRINAPSWHPINALDVHILLKEGVLTLEPFKLGMANGTIAGKLIFDGSRNMPVVTSDLTLKRLSLRAFFDDTRFEALTKGVFGGKIQIKGQGKSLADVLASSDGRITTIMAGGQISLLIMEAAGMDIAEATPLLLDQDRTTHIRCAVGDFKVTQGILNSDVFVFDTQDTNVEGKASINLRDESIEAIVEAHPKDGSILAAKTPITITGRLKYPNVGISPFELGGRGAAAAVLGALLTPVAAIIPFIELGTGEDSDCQGLIAYAQSKSQKPVN